MTELVEVDFRETRAASRERALVLEAAGIEYAHQQDPAGWRLLVHPVDASRAARELASYAEESGAWDPRPARARSLPTVGWSGALLWTTILGVFWLLQTGSAFDADWARLGRTEGAMTREGEWWRAVTSLTLHADGPHVAGNLLFGALFVGVAGQFLGTGLALFGAFSAGTIGNLLNGAFRGYTSTSLGASTAVFAALGLFVAAGFRHRRREGGRWHRRWMPLAAGLAFLGFLGTSGERTDVLAHALGFGVGVTIGAPASRLADALAGRAWPQALAVLATALLLAAAWLAAFRFA